MTIEEALYAKLSATSGVTALVGANIYPMVAAQSATLPWLTFQNIHDKPVNALAQLPTLTECSFQFTAWSGTYGGAKGIAGAVVAALAGFTGLMGGAGGVTVGACLKDGETDGYEGDPKTFFCRVEFMIWHNAT